MERGDVATGADDAVATRHRVVVCIPTYRRPAQLETLLRALGRQRGAPDFAVIIGDNDPGSVSTSGLGQGDRPPRTVIDVSVRGVTAVRNAMIAHALSNPDLEWIACIDDDQVPADDWLHELVAVGVRYSGDLVGGPVVKKVASPTFWSGSAADTTYLPTAEGIVSTLNEAGNLLVSASFLRKLGRPPFSEDFGRTGGEDYEFFLHARSLGARFVWAPDARVDEDLPSDRLTFRGYVWRFYSIAAYQARADRLYGGFWKVVARTLSEALKAPLVLGRSLLFERSATRGITVAIRLASVTVGRIVGLFGKRAERYGQDA